MKVKAATALQTTVAIPSLSAIVCNGLENNDLGKSDLHSVKKVSNSYIGTSFRFLSTQLYMGRKNALYKNVRIASEKYKGGIRQFVSFHYRIPETVRPDHAMATWKRFKVFEDINRAYNKGTDYADRLLRAVADKLEAGFNPFEFEVEVTAKIKEQERQVAKKEKPKMSLATAFKKFLEDCEEKKLEQKTLSAYKTMITFMTEYLGNRVFEPVEDITREDVKEFLSVYLKKQDWSNRTYNNKRAYLGIIFNWFQDEQKYIQENPVDGIKPMNKVAPTVHTYFDDKQAIQVKKAMLAAGPRGKYLHDFSETIYYTLTRPGKETRQLKCGDVLWDRGLLRIDPLRAKKFSGGYIPMCKELITLFKKMGVDKYPDDYYIFTTDLKPGLKAAGEKFFADNFLNLIKIPMNLSKDYTLYGWKHTRAIQLAKANVSPYDIQKLCRHKSIEDTMKYLRDLGCEPTKEINNNTKKF